MHKSVFSLCISKLCLHGNMSAFLWSPGIDLAIEMERWVRITVNISEYNKIDESVISFYYYLVMKK